MTAAEHSEDARQHRHGMAARMAADIARWQRIWDTVSMSGVVPASLRGSRIQLSLDDWEQLFSLETLVPPETRTTLPAPGGNEL